MKSTAVLSALVAASAVQAGLVPPQTNNIDWKMEQKRQILGTLTSLIGKGGRVADPAGAAPRRVELKATSVIPGARRIKMRYGPYSVPNMNKTSITGEAGALWNYPDTSIQKPCTECVIIGQQAGLEYPDGKNANIDTGMWLHHMVHFTIGAGRQDATCYGRASLPHVDVGASPANSQRYFSSGNERTHVQLDKLGLETKWGYQLKPSDRMAFIVDLMNMNMEDKTVYLTMYYDILDGKLPAGWRDVMPVWFDANQCGTSEVAAKKQNGQFVIPSGSWKPNFEGEVLGVGGHLHDGGSNLLVKINGKTNCDSTAKYGESPEFVFKGQMGAMGAGTAKDHISSMHACYFKEMPITKLSRDQVWTIEGNYDYDKYPGDKDEHGKQSSVMAIAIMFVAVEPGTTLSSGTGAAGAAAPAAGGRGQRGSPKGAIAPKAASAPLNPATPGPPATAGQAGMVGAGGH